MDTSRLDLRLKGSNTTSSESKRLVVVGGGYAGTKIVQKVVRDFPQWEVILIDSKDYFENTIAVLTILTHVDINSSVNAAMKIVLKYENLFSSPQPNYRFLKDYVKDVTPTKVIAATETLYYDYLVLACGTSYQYAMIKTPNVTADFRVQSLSKDALELSQAEDILIIGGGLVGTELAGEIIHKYPNKKVTLVTAPDRLLARLKPSASASAHKYLTSKGVNIIYGERVRQSTKDPSTFVFPNARGRVKPGKAYWCTGFRANSSMLVNHFPESLSANGYVKVNEHFQMKGVESQNIFAIGDLTDLAEEKMAERAGAHASFVAKTLTKIVKGLKLEKEYKPPKKPAFQFISLGPEYALMVTGHKVTTQGSVASSLKHWSFGACMTKPLKIAISKDATKLTNLETRMIIEKETFLTPENKQITIIGLNSRPTEATATVLAHFGIAVHIAVIADVERSATEQLTKQFPLIKACHIDPKIIQTYAASLKGSPTVLFPAILSSTFMETFDKFQPHLLQSFKDGVLKRLIVVHGGYQWEKAGKKRGVLNDNYAKLEEAAKSIDPKLKVIIIRHAPPFEIINIASPDIKTDRIFRWPLTRSLPFIAAEDIRDCLLAILNNPTEHDDKIYSICGDEKLSPEAICEAITAAVATPESPVSPSSTADASSNMPTSPRSFKPVTFELVEPSAVMPGFLRIGGKEFAVASVEFYSNLKHLAKMTDDLQTILGKPAISYADWANLHSHLFV